MVAIALRYNRGRTSGWLGTFLSVALVLVGANKLTASAAFVSSPSGAQDGGWMKLWSYEHPDQISWDIDGHYAYAQLYVGFTQLNGGLMHFPLAGAPQEIVSASLRFYVDSFRMVEVDHIDVEVASEVALWEVQAPQTPVLRFYDDTGAVHYAQWFDVDVTAAINQDLRDEHGFAAFGFTSLSGYVYLSESGGLGPGLTIVPVPEPSSLAALLLGLGGYTGWRRKWRWRA